MGVPRFFRWLTKRYSNTVVQLPVAEVAGYFTREKVATLALDLNGIIHTQAGQVYKYAPDADLSEPALRRFAESTPEQLEREHFHGVSRTLYHLLQLTQPQSTLIIGVDGPAPLPKLVQQRSRRFRARSSKGVVSDGYLPYTPLAQAQLAPNLPEGSYAFDSNSITPGTELMDRLDRYLRAWIESNRDLLPERVIYSSHQVMGEGEHKIKDWLQRLTFPTPTDQYSQVVHGLDADLIMLALLSPQKNYKLLREDVFNAQEVYYILDIEKLRQRIREEIGSVEDFVLLSYLGGNDFLPAFPSISIGNEGMDLLLQLYKEVGLKLTREGNRIHWGNLLRFFERFAQQEGRLLARQGRRGSRFPSVALQDSYQGGNVDLPKFYQSYYQRALGAKGRQLNTSFPLDNPETRLIMAQEWLGSLAWVYKYYQEGMNGVNVDYTYPYYYAPLAQEITTVLKELTPEGVPQFEWQALLRKGRPLLPLEQLVSVLPPASGRLVPASLRALLSISTTNPLEDLFPTQFLVDLSSKQEEHEGVALLPLPDLPRIRKAVSGVELTRAEQRRNRKEEDWVDKRY